MKQLIFISDIDIKNSPRVRQEISKEAVFDYAEAYRRKEPLPPPHVFRRKGLKDYLLADGLHRIGALQLLKRAAIECEVHLGGYEEALKFALTCNRKHGLRRTNEDKRRCIASAILAWPKQTDNHLASICGVDHKTVTLVRKEMESQLKVEKAEERRGADNKTYKKPAKAKDDVGNSQGAESQVDKSNLPVLDATGCEIPPKILPLWYRAPEVMEVLETVSKVRKYLEKAEKAEDPLWREPFLNKAIADLCALHSNLSTAIPYAVCSICSGHPEIQPNGDCRGCKGRGFMSKFRWDRVPDNIKALRPKGK